MKKGAPAFLLSATEIQGRRFMNNLRKRISVGQTGPTRHNSGVRVHEEEQKGDGKTPEGVKGSTADGRKKLADRVELGGYGQPCLPRKGGVKRAGRARPGPCSYVAGGVVRPRARKASPGSRKKGIEVPQ